MNKKGQAVFVGIMIGIMVFITMVQFIPLSKDFINDARSPSKLDCNNNSISVGNKATCVIVDAWFPYFFGIGIAAGVAFISGRKLGIG